MAGAAEELSERRLAIDPQRATKDLAHSRLGTNAGGARYHYSLKSMLESGRFEDFVRDIGRPVIRMDERACYGWSGRGEMLKLREAEGKLRFLRQSPAVERLGLTQIQPGEFASLTERLGIAWKPEQFALPRNHPDLAWYSPEAWHRFCRTNGLRLFGAVNDTMFYVPETGEVRYFRNAPEHFAGAVDDFRRKLIWARDNGYLDLYIGWEIGNECWNGWDPVLYAQYARMILAAATEIQPDIKLALPVMLRNTDDPAIVAFIAKDPGRRHWFDWHEAMLPALGEDIRRFSHLQIHVYGSDSCFSANARGLENISAILAKVPGTDHFRYWVTEWRYTGVGGTRHRTFRTAALWNAKFAMLLLSHPRIDESAAHEFVLTSGLGYWTPGTGNAGPHFDGSEWVYQAPEATGGTRPAEQRSTHGLPAFDLGPFGPVNRMLNELVRECPVLIEHQADLGPMSSALFSEGTGGDLDWFIARTADGTTLGGVVVNTLAQTVALRLEVAGAPVRAQQAEVMVCDPARVDVPEIPGEAKAWRLAAACLNQERLIIPPGSILSFRASIAR